VLLLYESNTDVDYSELWIYIEPMCRIVGGRYATIVRRTPVSGVQGLGRNLMDVFRLRRRLVDDYGSYVSSFIRIKDERIEEEVLSSLGEGLLWPDPLIQLNPSFEAGETIDELVAEGTLHEECGVVFRRKKDLHDQGEDLRLHRHQADAIRTARAGHNYVLTTGTGSGKSLAYVALGRLGGAKGGKARAANMTKKELSEAGRKAANARWEKWRRERQQEGSS
jgi:hypothetical protein